MRPIGDFVTAFAPVARLGEFEGISIVVSTVEMWTSHFLIALVAERNELTERLDVESRAEIHLSRAPLMVHDNVKTNYRVNGIASGGTGNEWRSEWRFEPGPSPRATHLEISLDLVETEPLLLPLR